MPDGIKVYDARDVWQGTVTLNGFEIEYAVRCCPSGGWVERQVRDENGRCVIEGDTAKIERLYGRIECELSFRGKTT